MQLSSGLPQQEANFFLNLYHPLTIVPQLYVWAFTVLTYTHPKKIPADEEKILRGAPSKPDLSVLALELLTPDSPPSQGSGVNPMDMSSQSLLSHVPSR